MAGKLILTKQEERIKQNCIRYKPEYTGCTDELVLLIPALRTFIAVSTRLQVDANTVMNARALLVKLLYNDIPDLFFSVPSNRVRNVRIDNPVLVAMRDQYVRKFGHFGNWSKNFDMETVVAGFAISGIALNHIYKPALQILLQRIAHAEREILCTTCAFPVNKAAYRCWMCGYVIEKKGLASHEALPEL